MADELGLELGLLAHLFPDKARVEREDVQQAVRQLLERRPPAGLASAPTAGPAGAPGKAVRRRAPLGSVRRRIAERMAHSAHTTAPVTLTAEVDATELVRLRETRKAAAAPLVPSYNALFTKIIATTLAEHPALNASLVDDEIVLWESINVGCAVDTERGLVVPVVREVQSKTLAQLTEEMDGLLKRAAEGKAKPDELTGGTFTLTNLGAFGIDAFTPIINPPETAVLGVGRLAKKMVVVGDQPLMRTLCVLSLTFDHRLVDGGPAARCLQRLGQLVEQPYLWLI
jgi:pyruvate dehydrogenase E2 component (dihydrolipoamide acetyltransferase)